MNRERQAKHQITPLPTERQFFKYSTSDVQNKSKEKGNLSKFFKISSIIGFVDETDDPFRYTSEESIFSDSETDTDNSEAWVTTDEENVLGSENTEFPSPEKFRFQDNDDSIAGSDISPPSTSVGLYLGQPKYALTGIQANEESSQNSSFTLVSTTIGKDFGNPKFTSSGILGKDFGKPKFALSRIQDNDDESVQMSSITHASTIIGGKDFGKPNFASSGIQEHGFGSPKLTSSRREDYFEKRKNIVDSHFEELENISQQHYFEEKGNIADSHIENNSPQHYFDENESIVDSPSKDLENISPQLPVLVPVGITPPWKNFDNQDKEDEVSFITTIKTTDIVDDVFKNSKDKSSLKFNDAAILSQEMSFGKSQMLNISENIPEERKKKLERKRHVKKRPDSSLKQKSQDILNLNKKNKTISKMTKYEKYEEYLQTLEVCPLSLSKAPFNPSKGLVKTEGKRRSKRGKSPVFRNKKLTRNQEEEFSKYEEYLKGIPICPLSINKTRFVSDNL